MTRIDKWLWAARFFKTRSLAKTAVEGGKVHINGQRVKAAKAVTVGDRLTITRGSTEQIVDVAALSERRGSASLAAELYAETEESITRRAEDAARRKMERAGLQLPPRRPNKKDRRALRDLKLNDEP